MSVTKKLAGAFVIICTCVALMSWASMRAILLLGRQVDSIGHITGKKALLCGELQGYSAKIRGALRGAILYSTHDMNKTAVADRCAREFHAYSDAVKRIAGELDGLQPSPAELDATRIVRQAVDEWQPVANEIISLSAQGQFGDSLTATTMHSLQLADQLDKATDILVKAQTQAFAASAGQAEQVSARGRITTIPLVGLTVFMCAAGLWVMRNVNRILCKVAESILHGSDQIRSASSHVAAASQLLAQNTAQEAVALEETSASSTEINEMAGKNTEGTESAADLVSDSERKFAEADRYLDEMVEAIDAIHQSSGKITNIIKVIDEIAFQTNILALNAAVEAARAGEAGAGFAIIADEVRNLAQRSAQAARESSTLIEESATKSAAGAAKVDLVAGAIHAITADAARIKTLVHEVHERSAEQARGIDQISGALMQIEQTTQTTAATAEESASAAEQLSAQAETMRNAAAELGRLVGTAR